MKGETYQAEGGHWSWVIYDSGGIDVARGAGYESEESAHEDMMNELATYTETAKARTGSLEN